jgi:hypothetical protein
VGEAGATSPQHWPLEALNRLMNDLSRQDQRSC